MGTIRQKWNSRRGASILIALVFFLLCLMVGAVMLTAATASAGHLRTQRQAQREYLTVSSAARLVRDLLSEKKFAVVTEDGAVTSGPTCDPVGAALSQTIQLAAKETFDGGKPASRTLRVDATDIEGISGEVVGELSMDADCNLTVTLAIEEDGALRVPLVLRIPAFVSDRTWIEYSTKVDAEGNERKESKTIRTYRVTWGTGTITRGDGHE